MPKGKQLPFPCLQFKIHHSQIITLFKHAKRRQLKKRRKKTERLLTKNSQISTADGIHF
jgi:hypothetical protein